MVYPVFSMLAVAGLAMGAEKYLDEKWKWWRPLSESFAAEGRGLRLLECVKEGDCLEFPRCGVVVAPGPAAKVLAVDLKDDDSVVVVPSTKTEWWNATEIQLIKQNSVRRTVSRRGDDGTMGADQALVALSFECRKKMTSPRLDALRRVAEEMTAEGSEVPFAPARVAAWREVLGGAAVDIRGLWPVVLDPDAESVSKADTPLLRSARTCDARSVRAWLALGADASSFGDSRGFRALDLAITCDSRSLFGTAKEIIDACGAPCVVRGGETRDGLGPIHRVLTRWASSFFPSRPSPNPWNALLHHLVTAGGPEWQTRLLLEPTGTPARETPLHIAVAKRNVAAVKILLAVASKSDDGALLRAMLDAKDGLGGHTPLAVAFAWRNWAVTLPRSLAAAKGSPKNLRLQALDGVATECEALFPKYDPDLQGYPLTETAEGLAQCGFLHEIPTLLLEAGARLDARDDLGRTPLHHAHPSLLDRLPLQRAAQRDGVDLDTLRLDSQVEQRLWERKDLKASNVSALDDPDSTCDVTVMSAIPDVDALKHRIRDEAIPVLVLNALDPSWDDARRHWAPDRLKAHHGTDLVRAGPIPYSSAFAARESLVSLADAMAIGRSESQAAVQARAQGTEDIVAPTYVFEQIRWASPRDHPLGTLVKAHAGNFTPLLGPDVQIHNAQFYAVPKSSLNIYPLRLNFHFLTVVSCV